MINSVYERVCKKKGHNWAYQDNETFMTKICLNCFAEQFFFPEEVNEE